MDCSPTKILYWSPIFGFSWGSCSGCLPSRSLHSTPPRRPFPQPITRGCGDLRLAVVSPFVDRRHGSERALAELLEHLAHKEHCEIHLYSQRVEALALTQAGVPSSQLSLPIISH